jgi:hypothetical protein
MDSSDASIGSPIGFSTLASGAAPRRVAPREAKGTAQRAAAAVSYKPSVVWLWQRVLDPAHRSQLLLQLDATQQEQPRQAQRLGALSMTRPRASDVSVGTSASVSPPVNAGLATLVGLTRAVVRGSGLVPMDGRDVLVVEELADARAGTSDEAAEERVARHLRSLSLARWWAAVEAFCGHGAHDVAPMMHIPCDAYSSIMTRIAELCILFESPTVHNAFPAVTPASAAAHNLKRDTDGRLMSTGVPKSVFLESSIVAVSRAWAPAPSMTTEALRLKHDAAFLNSLLPFVFALDDTVVAQAFAAHPVSPLVVANPSSRPHSSMSARSRPSSSDGRTRPPRLYQSNAASPFADDSTFKVTAFPARLPSAGLLRHARVTSPSLPTAALVATVPAGRAVAPHVLVPCGHDALPVAERVRHMGRILRRVDGGKAVSVKRSKSSLCCFSTYDMPLPTCSDDKAHAISKMHSVAASQVPKSSVAVSRLFWAEKQRPAANDQQCLMGTAVDLTNRRGERRLHPPSH